MSIDLIARLKNKAFWITMIPALFLVIQAVAKVVGIELDFASLSDDLINLVNVLFTFLAILGITVDTSTDGFSDVTTTE